MKFLLEEYLHKKIQVVINRPLGSKHPDFETIYNVNYGYLPGTKAPDGEEIDAYVLGVDKPIEKFEGRVIAIIHRLDNDDDKLVVAPERKDFSKDEIKNLTNFQEKYFKSEIIK
jgi:inorganic pyrophosphatase